MIVIFRFRIPTNFIFNFSILSIFFLYKSAQDISIHLIAQQDPKTIISQLFFFTITPKSFSLFPESLDFELKEEREKKEGEEFWN